MAGQPNHESARPLPALLARLLPTRVPPPDAASASEARPSVGAAPDSSGDSVSRWIAPSVLIGVVAGLGAVALFGLLHVCSELILEHIAGYHPYRTAAEGGPRDMSWSERPWAVPLVAGGGALVATLLAVWLAPEARGHGTDAAIDTAHHDPAGMRGRVPVVKLIASALTIGSGGSGGTEGPAAQISAGFGSVIARRTGMSHEQARTAVVIGLAAGVGAIFRAPLGAALLGAEILYRRGMDTRILPQALIASCAGWLTFGCCYGFDPMLGHGATDVSWAASDFALLAATGVLCGLTGRLYTSAFYAVHLRTEAHVRSLPARIAAPVAAALLVGLLGLVVPGVPGTGYGLIQALTDRDTAADFPLLLLALMPLAKIAATALTVGSGGSGGIFGPCMVVGAGVGAFAWHVGVDLHAASTGPLPYVVVGMAACLGPVANSPIGVLIMATEMVGDAALLGPGLLAVLCASTVTGHTTLYRSQRETPVPPTKPSPPDPNSPPK
ncbi:chloride channel protein [Yinghuangia sp. ASG 101]|uniref:chloride channel protein n=1 Tax=Yinghuangia sp. ASG 101 TaxID=2896848 RepID=UPI001E45F443|nr:chloride channel protein [Yinghuangia sp. ASG 101]UGQ11506.1 chloride channel protein [Yinghuangia sp. ASG 101]